jgi:hypothetical protein
MVYIFTNKETSLNTLFPKNTQFLALAEIPKHTPAQADLLYIDVTALSDADLKKTLTQIKKICKANHSVWGIIDPKGNIKDIAALFFDGVSDYLGPVFFKGSANIEPKRFKEALTWRRLALGDIADSDGSNGNEKTAKEKEGGFIKNAVKLPSANAFSGWKKMQAGKQMPFFLLYCSLKGKIALESRFEDKTIAQIHKRFLSYLTNIFAEIDGLLWMDSGKDCLFLFPPKTKSGEAIVEKCIRMIISAPLLTLETLGLSIPVNFVFALHYDTVNYMPPGKTGTVVSDAVNFIFHLGPKKAEPGRLTVSGEIPDVTIPKSLEDCFLAAGEYEGRKIWHTKKINYANTWL